MVATDDNWNLTNEEFYQVLDTLGRMPKLLWEYLSRLPAPLADNELAELIHQGFIQKIHNLYRLTPLGNAALAQASVPGEQGLLSSGEIAYLQSLTFLPSPENLKLLKETALIENSGGQIVLTPRGLIAKAEISSSEKVSHRLLDSLDKIEGKRFENSG
ncbi:MAG: hypothetical protein RBG13Loki_1576 [Promethearchaeota archaeon CR_4]|nr:MAG: hypothetical protein RBG13Loki_1576 [Candidatus Lokiarchaeota archaeon CR_4]